MSSLLTLNKFLTISVVSFHCWIWTRKYQVGYKSTEYILVQQERQQKNINGPYSIVCLLTFDLLYVLCVITDALARRCSAEMFWNISQNWQEKNCVGVSLRSHSLQVYLTEALAKVFFCEFDKNSRNTFL